MNQAGQSMDMHNLLQWMLARVMDGKVLGINIYDTDGSRSSIERKVPGVESASIICSDAPMQ